MTKRIVVTSALPYANGQIHIGHLVEYIQTDIFVRFLKLIGKDAIYCCADDTHGTPIEIKASQLKIKPEELIKKVHKEHLEDFKSFHINFDSYYSTNSEENKHYADKIFNALKDKDLIYTKDVENFYDEKEKRFLPDRYVKGECPKCGALDQYGDVCEKCNATYKPIDLVNPYSTVSGEKPIRKSSEHYFFKLSELSDKLDKYLTENKNLQPEIVNYVRNWIKEGLQDWDISRDGPYFGFKIPGEADKYYYVWLDAPVGYIASTENYCNQNNLNTEKDYWKNKESEIIHFIGKDIIYFHFLFWPAMLMESGFNVPNNIIVHGFLTINGEKMSKSRGTFFTAKEALKLFEPEYLRYYYAKNLSKKMSDIDLDIKDFQDSINNELVANIGNFTYRVLSFLDKNYDGEITTIDDQKDLEKDIFELVEKVKDDYSDANFKSAVKNILHISAIGNRYFQDTEPWKLIKYDRDKVQEILGFCVNIVKNLSILLSPILPELSAQLNQHLNLEQASWEHIDFKLINHKTNKPKIIFNRIEEDIKIDLEDKEKTFPLDLKVAKILEAKDHPDAEKLLVLQIDLGKEKRQLVAGLKGHYTPEDLIGKQIIVVSNLKPAKLRGVDSQGMLLAASTKDKSSVTVLEAPKSLPGDQVIVDNHKINDKQITFDDFQKIKIITKENNALFNDLVLKTKKEDIHVEAKDGLRIG